MSRYIRTRWGVYRGYIGVKEGYDHNGGESHGKNMETIPLFLVFILVFRIPFLNHGIRTNSILNPKP